MNSSTKIKRNLSVLQSRIDEDYVLMSLEENGYYGLNSVAGRVWELIEKEISFQDLISTLMEEYNVEYETCKKDVERLLSTLIKSNLVEVIK